MPKDGREVDPSEVGALAAAGVPLPKIVAVLAHANLQTTAIYITSIGARCATPRHT